MPGNTFGKVLRLSTFGESHGPAIGGILDGFPAGLELDLEAVQAQLDRRKPGQSRLSSQRKESDSLQILSGVFEGKSTGTPIGLLIPNDDSRSKDYDHLKDNYRPSHADRTYSQKYGHRDYRGGGRSSARETAVRVAAGALAMQIIPEVKIRAYVSAVGPHQMDAALIPDLEQIDANDVRCPDPKTAETFEAAILAARKVGDSLGGIITCHIEGLPPGLGEPVFDKLPAELAKAMMSINAVKGFEIGEGFKAATMTGSEHNDTYDEAGNRKTNHAGGVEGGLSTGEDLIFRVAFKPVATLMRDQQGLNEDGETVNIKGKGRHDPCVVPRAVPIVEAMAALVIADYYLLNRTSKIEL
ncbi:chorismate synthase [Croceimicrobium sp.]|uniref:chorismate synthase n=1 Tax=Croceimicrobium sp. TaxID=2828340 RepID=UPI003BAB7818